MSSCSWQRLVMMLPRVPMTFKFFPKKFQRKHLRRSIESVGGQSTTRSALPRGTHNEQEKCDNSWFYSIQSRWKLCGLTFVEAFSQLGEKQMFSSMIGKSLFGVEVERWDERGSGFRHLRTVWGRRHDAFLLITHSCATLHNHFTIITLLMPLGLLRLTLTVSRGWGRGEMEWVRRLLCLSSQDSHLYVSLNFSFDLSRRKKFASS